MIKLDKGVSADVYLALAPSEAYHRLMNIFIPSLQVAPGCPSGPGGSSSSSGMSPFTMTLRSSIGPRSAGKGNLFLASSNNVNPVDQTSERIEYGSPRMRSGCEVISFYKRGSETGAYRHVPACASKSPCHRVDQDS